MSDATAAAPYELYYWPGLPGRGEFIRLTLEEAGVPYVDFARRSDAIPALQAVLRGELGGLPPLAPPVLRAGEVVLAQVAAINLFVAARHGLAPADPRLQAAANQLALTIADLVSETHDTHHPLAKDKVYEAQKEAAKAYAAAFTARRMPKFLGYFERVLERGDGEHLIGGALSYVDLSMFQALEGLAYAFPNAHARCVATLPRLRALRDRVAARPRIAAYLASERRQSFCEHGIFRRYPELDEAAE
ncbi:MAG: glutathione S-transferase [Nannocystaceae bacterium]